MKKLLKSFMRIAVFVAFLALSMGLQATASQADNDLPHQRMVTVTGESKAEYSPDQAILSMSLISKDKDLNVAKRHNDALVERLVNISKEYKIPREKISTSSIYIAPEYNYNNSQQSFIGYTVNRSLRITIDDLSIQERLLSAIVDAKIDQVNGVEFQLSDATKYNSELQVKAFANAKAQAEALAQAAGAKLGPALSISTGENMNAFPRPPRPMMAMAAAGARSAESVAPTLPGTIFMQENVTVTFGLE